MVIGVSVSDIRMLVEKKANRSLTMIDLGSTSHQLATLRSHVVNGNKCVLLYVLVYLF